MAGCTADVERLRRFSPRMRAITTGRQERPVPSRVGPPTAHGTHSAALYMARGSVARRATSTRHASDGRTEDARRPRRSCAQSQPRTEGGQRLRELTRTALTRACPLLRRARSRRPRRVRYSSPPRRTIGCARRHNEGSESGQRKSTRGKVSSTASARTAFCDCNARQSHAGFSSSRCASESSHLLHGESMMTASRRVLTADRAPWRALSMSGLWMGPTSCLYARVRCDYQSNYSHGDIAAMLGMSNSTVKRLLRYYREHGTDRIPCQGQGKHDDRRWVFAGPRGPAALALLERVKQEGDDGDLLREVHEAFERAGASSSAYRTLCHALQVHLQYSSKRVRASLTRFTCCALR